MKLRAIITAGMLLASLAAYGAPGSELRGLPGNFTTDEDRQIVRDALIGTLEEQTDGVTTNWANPLTGSSGFIRPVQTFERDGMHCRKLEIRNIIDEQSNDWVFNFCKLPEGDWKIAP